jgi:hypothetical protein
MMSFQKYLRISKNSRRLIKAGNCNLIISQSFSLSRLFWQSDADIPEWIDQQKVFSQCLERISKHADSVVHKHAGIGVDIRSSTIPNSGNGLFAKAAIPKGSVVTLYPGIYYPPLPTWLVSLPDGNIAVDLRPQNDQPDFSSVYKINCVKGGFIEAKDYISSNIALAHLINHPPKGKRPNVITYEFFWEDFAKEMKFPNQNLLDRISCIREGVPWYVDPNSEEIVTMTKHCSSTVGMAFVASADIAKDEEIFFDYKFQDVDDLPLWYYAVESIQLL